MSTYNFITIKIGSPTLFAVWRCSFTLQRINKAVMLLMVVQALVVIKESIQDHRSLCRKEVVLTFFCLEKQDSSQLLCTGKA